MSFMATAVAVTAATGIYSAYSGYQASGVQADNIKAQAQQDRLDMQAQMKMDSAEESRVASAERKENRRLRAIQEGAYAKSGVLMEGSAADVLTKQREVDEANVQNIHIGRGNQRAQDIHKMNRDYQSSVYLADATRSAGKTNALTSILSTAGSASMGASQMWSPGATAPAASAFGSSAFPTQKPVKFPSSSVGQYGGAPNPFFK